MICIRHLHCPLAATTCWRRRVPLLLHVEVVRIQRGRHEAGTQRDDQLVPLRMRCAHTTAAKTTVEYTQHTSRRQIRRQPSNTRGDTAGTLELEQPHPHPPARSSRPAPPWPGSPGPPRSAAPSPTPRAGGTQRPAWLRSTCRVKGGSVRGRERRWGPATARSGDTHTQAHTAALWSGEVVAKGGGVCSALAPRTRAEAGRLHVPRDNAPLGEDLQHQPVHVAHLRAVLCRRLIVRPELRTQAPHTLRHRTHSGRGGTLKCTRWCTRKPPMQTLDRKSRPWSNRGASRTQKGALRKSFPNSTFLRPSSYSGG
jgi:hypothetical protein